MNLEDPRVLRTRQLIRDSFREMLRSKGFDAITIKDVAHKATINRATYYGHYEDKYALLDETIEQAFNDMIPEEVRYANEFNNEICDQLILMTHRYIVDFHQLCRMSSREFAKIVDEKIKKMLEQTIESVFLKEATRQTIVHHRIKILSAMTSSAIYGAAYSWFRDSATDRDHLLVDIVRPYVMKGLDLYRNDESFKTAP